MDVRVTLLLITAVHAAAAISNGTRPRSFALIRHTETFTYEPFDFSSQEEETRPNQTKPVENSSHRIRLGPLCNSSAQNCNKTATVVTLRISEQAKTFLTGPLVTGFIPTVYGLVFLISVPLNALALVAFFFRIRQKKPVVVYMSQLALADLLFGLLLPLKVHYYASGSQWVFGEAACRAVTTVFYAYMNCSVLLVMCMSVDRMLAVVFPVASSLWRKPRNARLVCAGAWFLALVAAMPLLTINQTVLITEVGITCHDVLEPEDPLYLPLFTSISCLIYFLPLFVTLSCYAAILRTLKTKTKSLQGALASSSLSRKRRRRATVMVISVMVEFLLCFAPTNMILLLHCLLLGKQRSAGADELYAAYILAVCVGSVSACLDPLLYYFGSSQCREQIHCAMWWRKGKKAAAPSQPQSSSSWRSCNYNTPCRTETELISCGSKGGGGAEDQVGMDHSTVGIDHSTVGIKSSTMGMDPSTVDMDHFTVCINASTVGMGHSTVGINPSTVGMGHCIVGMYSTEGINPSTVSMDHSTVGINPSTMGMDHCIVGMDYSTVGINPSTMSMDHSTKGVNPSTMDMEHSTVGINSSIVGMDHSTMGINPSIMGMNHSTVGINPSSVGMDYSTLGINSSIVTIDHSTARPSTEKSPIVRGFIGDETAEGVKVFYTGQIVLNSSLTKVFLPVVYIIIFIVGLPTNAMAVWVFLFRTKKKHPASILMANLALADLLFIVWLPLKIAYHLNGNDWIFGEPLCRVLVGFFYGNMYCSAIFIACISVQRYWAIAHPLSQQKRNNRVTACVCVGVWVVVWLITVPLYLYEQTVKATNLNIITCHDVTRPSQSHIPVGYFLTMAIVGYVVPCVVCIVAYVLMFRSLRSSMTDSNITKKRKKAIILIITVLVMFLVCFTPSNIMLVVHYSLLAAKVPNNGYGFYIITLCLSSLNSCLDPFVYYFISEEFRDHVRNTLMCRSERTANRMKVSFSALKFSKKSNTNSTHTQSTTYTSDSAHTQSSSC
ncbi:hypothetical protein NFI96_025218 [Prochilodus magdalenae]|nr:hypothetical protein NFI96_025218 [Prochilodus magdalenae]